MIREDIGLMIGHHYLTKKSKSNIFHDFDAILFLTISDLEEFLYILQSIYGKIIVYKVFWRCTFMALYNIK